MKTKKLIALSVLLISLLLAPMIFNAASSNQWTPITFQQFNTQSKQTAIPTDNLSKYISSGDNLTYDSIMENYVTLPAFYADQSIQQLIFEFLDGPGDWYIVNMTIENDSLYFAIDNTTREIGLNGTGGLFFSVPSLGEIHRQTGVYSFLALPTGIVVGDNVEIILPFGEDMIFQVKLSVIGSTTTPTINYTDMTFVDFYNNWRLEGTFRNSTIALTLNHMVERESGILVTSFMGGSGLIEEEGLGCINIAMQFNSSISSTGILVPAPNTDITRVTTPESGLLADIPFTYNESGYWSIDFTSFNATMGYIRLNSVDGSYVNFTLRDATSPLAIPIDIGISQAVKIPDHLWDFIEDMGDTWNPSYYNSSTHIGKIDDLFELYYIINVTRYYTMGEGILASNIMFMASPWINEGAMLFLLTVIPMFWPNNTIPGFAPDSGYPLPLAIPFRVTGAGPVSIGGYAYDCWKAESLLPTGLSIFNVSQFKLSAYFERTSGILLEAKTDIEFKMPMDLDGDEIDEYYPLEYHKTWTLSDVDGVLPLPEDFSVDFCNIYSLTVPANELWTLDPSMFNGGSVTVNCSEGLNMDMYTMTRSYSFNRSIDGKPVVKFLNVNHDGSVSAVFYHATVNFYYTPSELKAMGAKASGFDIYAWNGSAWVSVNATVDTDERVVSADAGHFSSFALVAAPLTLFDILGPLLPAIIVDNLVQAANPNVGGIPVSIFFGGAIIAVLAIAVIILAKRH